MTRYRKIYPNLWAKQPQQQSARSGGGWELIIAEHWTIANLKANLNGISTHSPEVVYVVSMSLVLFPRELLENLVLVEMNKNIKKEKIEVFLYFLQRIGIFMSAVCSFRSSNFWIIQLIETFRGATYLFHDCMYLWRLKSILRKFSCIDSNPLACKDHFWYLFQFIDRWNNIVVKIFNTSCVS